MLQRAAIQVEHPVERLPLVWFFRGSGYRADDGVQNGSVAAYALHFAGGIQSGGVRFYLTAVNPLTCVGVISTAADGRTATSKCARISAYSLHPGILGDGNIAAAPFIAAADTCAAPPAIGNNLPAGDGDTAAVLFGAAADASAENPAIGGDFSAGDGDITAAP